MDTKKTASEPSRLMIHPALVVFKKDLKKVEKAEFNFEEKGNMNSAFAQFPKCKQSECDENPTEYGIGLNFSNKNGLVDF